ncbi:S1C family serine protease [Psychromicrobium lacuslunae]|uniref:PDZ domain-containing protein n=1 Tax=Psychromicrobium lacuslunae TaxID=1618207 RepID=A0A0D4BZF3_9MICC|nr:trypsin-like peptidase domain-containing protein [Psychromicrobium lacuslunae]AJT41505.1 hypothetical protein UM93_08235 [Psychromicrobium lacuslunae]
MSEQTPGSQPEPQNPEPQHNESQSIAPAGPVGQPTPSEGSTGTPTPHPQGWWQSATAQGRAAQENPNQRTPGQQSQGQQTQTQQSQAQSSGNAGETAPISLNETQPLTTAPGYPSPNFQPSTPAAEQPRYAHPQSTHPGNSFGAPTPLPPAAGAANGATGSGRKRFGTGALVAGMVIAAVIGAGASLGTTGLLAGGQSNAGSVQQSQNSPVIVNNAESVNAITGAAAKASPSVVTIGVNSGSAGGTGSGIILDSSGNILTNTHVVTLDGKAANPTIQVKLNDGRVFSAKIVGTDPLNDLAVIKIDATDLKPADLGDSSKVNVGDTAIAIGAPLGLSGTVTDGIVSTANRTISVASSAVPKQQSDSSQSENGGNGGFNFAPPDGSSPNTSAQGSININVIQTDAAINPGNSGGALVNSSGQVIGVNVAIAGTGSSSSDSSSGGNIGVGFSIPINTAKRIAQELISSGKASHGQLGVSVRPQSAGSDQEQQSSSSFTVGAVVAQVTSGSAAEKAGIKVGDVITNLGSRVIDDASSLTAAVREQAAGSTVKVSYLRGGKTQSVDVTLGAASE